MWLPPWSNPRNRKNLLERSHDAIKHDSEEKGKRGIGRTFQKKEMDRIKSKWNFFA
jgi:hypothetical protein